jgi:hypothetical protein
MITLTSEPLANGDLWVLEYAIGTSVIQVLPT